MGLRAGHRGNIQGLPRAPSRGGHRVSSGDTQSTSRGRVCRHRVWIPRDAMRFRPLKAALAGSLLTRASVPGGQDLYGSGE